MSTTGVPANDATINSSVAILDTKLEIVVIPVSDVDERRNFTVGSDGGSTPTSTTMPISA